MGVIITILTKNSIHHVTILAICLFVLVNISSAQWPNHGGGIANRRSSVGGLINPITVGAGLLRLRWKFLAGFDITATPALADGVVYFPSWNGKLYALNALNGELVWQQDLGQLTGLTPTGRPVNVTVSRATPVVANDLLIVGIYGPAVVIAVRLTTGQLVWSTRLDQNPRAIITQSGTVLNAGFYVGVSSLENTSPTSENCCTFRGSLVKLEVRTGRILWQTYTVPDNGGLRGRYAGASIWGSSPSIDVVRGLVYVGTGQLYSAPSDVLACQERENNQTTPTGVQCVPPDVHYDSLMGLDLNTGRIVWGRQLGGYDVFIFACLIPNNPDCPPGPNNDADFGEAPMLLTILSNGRVRDVVVAVQKSGIAWALDRGNGDIVWFTAAGPSSLEGGGIWGAATDGLRVYTNMVNADNVPFTLRPSNRTTRFGGWVAMDANTGRILWTTANPSNESAHGPVTVVNGVVFAGSVAPTGPLYAMDARTGAIIWSFDTGATVYGGVSAGYGCIYVGHGFSTGLARFHPTWNSGKYLFAFCIP